MTSLKKIMADDRRPCLISCGILKNEIEKLVERGDPDLDVRFLSENLHSNYNLLEKGLREAIKGYGNSYEGGLFILYGKEEIDRISDQTGLPMLEKRDVGLDGLKEVMLEAVKRLEQGGRNE
jgi:hypothetical protein